MTRQQRRALERAQARATAKSAPRFARSEMRAAVLEVTRAARKRGFHPVSISPTTSKEALQ